MLFRSTPGPWGVRKRLSCWAIVDAAGQDLAYQDDAPREYRGESCGCVTSRGRTEQELAGNARLIATAPELLEALEHLVNFTKGREHWPVVRKAEAVIAKAKGGVA